MKLALKCDNVMQKDWVCTFLVSAADCMDEKYPDFYDEFPGAITKKEWESHERSWWWTVDDLPMFGDRDGNLENDLLEGDDAVTQCGVVLDQRCLYVYFKDTASPRRIGLLWKYCLRMLETWPKERKEDKNLASAKTMAKRIKEKYGGWIEGIEWLERALVKEV